LAGIRQTFIPRKKLELLVECFSERFQFGIDGFLESFEFGFYGFLELFLYFFPDFRGVQRGVSKGVEDGRRPPALRVATPETTTWPFQWWLPLGRRGVGHAGP
jgi:hypothetical protein